MPRKPRLDGQGFLHHITARGIEKQNIFTDDADRNFFLERIGKILPETTTTCYAFALIPNHFHLLLRTGYQPISTVMRRLLTAYAIYFNRQQKRAGHLFQNRYKDIICQEDTYLLELIRYIHLNPLRAGIVSNFLELSRFKFCGHHFLVAKRETPSWFAKNQILQLFGNTTRKAQNSYSSFVFDRLGTGRKPEFTGGGLKRSLGYPKILSKERKVCHDERILGDSGFVSNLIKTKENPRKIDQSFKNINEVVSKVCKIYQLTEEELLGKARFPKVTEGRALVSYLATKYLGISAAAVGRHLGLNRSSIIRLIDKGGTLAKRISLP